MDTEKIALLIDRLEVSLEGSYIPIVTQLAETQHNPFEILISTVLSLRTKDEVTAAATERLFRLASTPERMLKLSEEEIRQAIYPVGFYRNKARQISGICRDLLDRFSSRVPDTLENLLSLNGVGRKTANLVLSLGYGQEAICVDTHVHRISNRLGLVSTKTPEQTESALQDVLPRCYWSRYNTLLVSFGQRVCRPLSPLCSTCPLGDLCPRIAVTRHR
ncbi:endonuclease-3 [Syntrophus gentianae]|uniref:Endonuclease III n=1 Tax=Syntrophus gentianae TaxID=43775 RepID=A0A1H7VR81_9BACT|nr:endonuclease III [Syntrophus gentianae]SEM11741.1 endonuclease-3 [Syntrophus gentianae]